MSQASSFLYMHLGSGETISWPNVSFLGPSAGITNQMSIDELSPCEEEAPPSPAEDERNQNGNLD